VASSFPLVGFGLNIFNSLLPIDIAERVSLFTRCDRAASDAKSLEATSKQQITTEGKAHIDEKAQQPRQVVSTFQRPAIPPWRDHRLSDVFLRWLLVKVL
jgi:hypothetical protein